MFPLVLLPAEVDPILEKKHSKKNLVSSGSPSNSEIVFTLLTKVVAVYMGLSAIYVQRISLQWLITGLLRGGESWGKSESGSQSKSLSLQNSFKNLLQVIFGIHRDISSSSRKLWPYCSIKLLGKLWLKGWTRAKGNNRGRGSDRKIIPAGTIAASN